MRGFGALFVGLTLVLSGPVMAAARAQVPTLPVQTPSVEVPSLPVPVPTVAPAPVPVPQVALPNVTAPSVPSPTGPTTPAPSLSPSQALPGSAPSAAPGSSGRIRDTAVRSGGGTSPQATAPLSGTSARGSTGSDGTGSDGTGSRGTGSGSHGAASAGGRRTAERWRSAGERRFRRTVRRLEPCLSTLPALTRRILVLRAGVGRQAVLTLAQTARRVDRRQRIVRRIERRGVRLLKAAMTRGECTGGSAGIAPDGEGTTGPLETTGPLFGVTGGELTVAGAGGPSGGSFAATGDVGGVVSLGGDRNRTGSGDRGGVKGEQREKQDRSLTNFPGLVSPGAKDITAPLLIVITLGGLASIAAWHRRRKRIEPSG